MRYFIFIFLFVDCLCFPVFGKQTKWRVTSVNYEKIEIPEKSPKKAELERIKKKPKRQGSRSIEGDDPDYVAWFIELLNTNTIENMQFREGFVEIEKGILSDSVPIGFWNSAKPAGGQKTWAEYMMPYFENEMMVLFVLDRAGYNQTCRLYPPTPDRILNPWAETFGADAILPKAQGLNLIQNNYIEIP